LFYRIIILSFPNINFAYIDPAYKIFRNISLETGKDISLLYSLLLFCKAFLGEFSQIQIDSALFSNNSLILKQCDILLYSIIVISFDRNIDYIKKDTIFLKIRRKFELQSQIALIELKDVEYVQCSFIRKNANNSQSKLQLAIKYIYRIREQLSAI